MKEKIIIAIFILFSFLSFSTVLAVEIPCAFYGTIKVNGTPTNGVYVTAHNNSDDKYLGTATEPLGGFGYYTITVNAVGSKIRLKYRNVFVDEPAQDCLTGKGKVLNLILNCTDCDNDGYNYTVDCDESNSNINPGKTELCNGIDDNCDGIIDNFTESCYTGPAGTMNIGICKAGIRTCTNATWDSCSGEITPQTETCNGIDDNCDGSVDEGVCGGGHSPTTTVSNSGSNGGSGSSGSGTNNVKTTTIITTTTVVPQTTTSNNETSNVNETTLITTTIPNNLGLTGLFSTDISSLGYWWILIIIMIVLLSILFIRKMNSNKNRPIEKSENETTTTNATENGPQ